MSSSPNEHSMKKDQLKKIRSLVRTKKCANVTLASQLLITAEASADNWREVFTGSVISLLVNTWDAELWNTVATVLTNCQSAYAEFSELAEKRFQKMGFYKKRELVITFYQTFIPEINGILCALIKHVDSLRIEIDKYPDEIIMGVSKLNGDLEIGIEEVSDESATYLAQHRGGLHIYGITELTEFAAKQLGGYRDNLSLDVEAISDSVAKSISNVGGNLSLSEHLLILQIRPQNTSVPIKAVL